MTIWLTVFFFLTAALYAAVGLGGGSGYLAAMALLGVAPDLMRPTALALNVLVAGIGSYKFYRAGHFTGSIFWPIAAGSIPAAFIGGRLTLSVTVYRPIVGLILLFAAYRLVRRPSSNPSRSPRRLPFWMALAVGGGIGLLSGLIGIGGGILLSPLLLLAGWANTRQTMGMTAAFVAVNSAAGLLGILSSVSTLPTAIPLWLAVVGVGGWIGAEYGSRRLDAVRLRQLLAFVLVVGGVRMIVG